MVSPVNDTYAGPSAGGIAGGRRYVSPFWRNLSPGWTAIEIAGTKPPAGILAYSGMALDEDGGKIYLFGGGHNDHGGNDVWELDIESRAAWEQHYTPTPIPSTESAENAAYVLGMVDNINYPGAIVQGGVPIRPISRHTYYSVHWIKSLNKFIAGGGSTYSGVMEWTWRDTPPWDGSDGVYYNDPRDTWLYDPVTKIWSYKGSQHLDANYFPYSRGLAYSSAANKTYCAMNNGNNQPLMRTYDIAGNSWSLTGGGVLGPMAYSWLSCFDTTRKRVVLLVYTFDSGIQLWSFDPSTLAWAVLSQSGAIPANGESSEGRAFIYSPVTDRLLLLSSNSNLKFYDMETGVWTTDSALNPPGFLQAFSTFTFDARRGVALLAYSSSYTTTVFAYKESP